MLEQILFALVLTLFIETIIYAFGNRMNFKTLVALSVANVVLNISMNCFLLVFKTQTDYLIALIICELLTIIIEAFVFFFFSKRKLWFAFLISFAANMTSWGFGNALSYLDLYKENEALLLSSIILFSLFTVLITISAFLFFAPGLFDKQDRNNNGRGNK